jgi:hypothetical protein
MQVMPAEDLVDMPVFVTEDMSSAEVFAEPWEDGDKEFWDSN